MSFRDIDSPQNPVVKAVAKLRTRRGRRQTGQIIVDGLREVERAIKAGFTLDQLFLPHDTVVDEAISARAEKVFQLSRRAFEKVGFGDRAELVATLKRPSADLDDLAVQVGHPLVVLERIEKPGNVGAIMRSADGAGAAGIVLVDPLCDPYSPNAIRASMGTAFHLPIVETSFEEFQQWSASKELHCLLAWCDPNAMAYDRVNYDQSMAIVLGNEAGGLDERWGDLASAGKVVIPMSGIADSLNVSVTGAILLYEATKLRRS